MKLVKLDRKFNKVERYYFIVIKINGKIRNEWEMAMVLLEYTRTTKKDKLVILAGHFPTLYTEDAAIEDFNRWGLFPKHSLELGCYAGLEARKRDKDVQFVLLADDVLDEHSTSLSTSQVRKRRRELYRHISGEDADLPEAYQDIMNRFGFSEADILRQDQGKPGREDCLYHSEKILRGSERPIENNCARAYVELLERLRSDIGPYGLLAFIPEICKGHVCDVALDHLVELETLHIFMDSSLASTKIDDIYAKGVSYRIDGPVLD